MSKLTHLHALILVACLFAFTSSTLSQEEQAKSVSVIENADSLNTFIRSMLDPIPKLKRIFIDPGHGGKDRGAVTNGIVEAEKNMQISLMLGNILKEKGYIVNYSRTNNAEFDTATRIFNANDWVFDLFVSIHCGYALSPRVSGTEVYFNPKGGPLAFDFAVKFNQVLTRQLSLPNRGVMTAEYSVLKDTNHASVLIILGYISNPWDTDKLKKYADVYADALASVFPDINVLPRSYWN